FPCMKRPSPTYDPMCDSTLSQITTEIKQRRLLLPPESERVRSTRGRSKKSRSKGPKLNQIIALTEPSFSS
ncbi:MAG: hypothetical protein ACOVNZ_06090, partial [Crocinitomicaceae bacterium]